MTQLNILITGVGAIIGYGIANSLRMTKRKLNIVGMDIYPNAAGQLFCDHFIQAKYANAPDYLEFLFEIIKKHNIDLVFFGTEQELFRVSEALDSYPEYMGKFVLNSKRVIDISKDKLKTHLFLSEHGIKTIPTRIDGSYQELVEAFKSPFILKLRHSYASKGVHQIHDEQDFNYWKYKSKGNAIFQKLVGNDNYEYTAAVFGLGPTPLSHTPFVMRRKLSREGSTGQAVLEQPPQLNKVIEDMVGLLQPIGPTNLQFRYHDGTYLLLEVNPRISSSTSIRAAFGYNEADMCIRHYLENSDISIDFSHSGSAVRYVSDWIRHDNRPHI